MSRHLLHIQNSTESITLLPPSSLLLPPPHYPPLPSSVLHQPHLSLLNCAQSGTKISLPNLRISLQHSSIQTLNHASGTLLVVLLCWFLHFFQHHNNSSSSSTNSLIASHRNIHSGTIIRSYLCSYSTGMGLTLLHSFPSPISSNILPRCVTFVILPNHLQFISLITCS